MSEPLGLIVGLGNPGPDYAGTRHNAGEWFVRELVRRCGSEFRPDSKFHGLTARLDLAGHDVRVLVPTTWMNRSGRAVSAVANFYRLTPETILVAHDELDFAPGTCRLKTGGGHGGHNGLRDIVSALGSPDFHRLRIGIGHPGNAREVHDYVLGAPSKADLRLIEAVIDEAVSVLPEMLACNWVAAMNRLHAFRADGAA